MLKTKDNKTVFTLLLFIAAMQTITAFNASLFWYMYTFTLLVCMAIALLKIQFFDELPTWQYALHGIGYGTLLYGLIRAGHELLKLVIPTLDQTITMFLQAYGPTNIWHYTILVFIIVIGEEMFWRGYVQQQFKKVVPPLQAIVISSLLFSVSLLIIGFIPGAISALLAGIIFGLLYEWKRSLPLIIVAHAVFVILLFLVLPLPL